MSKFTKENPFTFNGFTVARTKQFDTRAVKAGDLPWMSAELAEAIHAFIEAERDADQGWSWTNDAHTEARRGRWWVERNKLETSKWRFFHDDLAKRQAEVGSLHDDGTLGIDGKAWNVVRDFLAWKSAQEQPEEPTAIGYVLQANTPRGHTYTHVGNGAWVEDTGVRFDWREIADIAKDGAILSPGVDV